MKDKEVLTPSFLEDIQKRSSFRRSVLLNKMDELEGREISCRNCVGLCCTEVANSMQVTPLEAFEIVLWLDKEGLWNDSLKEKLEAVIKDFRLDHYVAGKVVRKTYRCPFFGESALGCALAPEIKPYGCLGFNPKEKGIGNGENCASDLELLKKRESLDIEEDKLNQQINEELPISFEKLPLPIALLEVAQSLLNK